MATTAVLAVPESKSTKPRKAYTEVFIINEATGQTLLGLKKRGAFTGLYHGFGGKVEPGESVAEGAQREVLEECGLQVSLSALEPKGHVDCEMQTHVFEIHFFTCSASACSGDIVESDEMAPAWLPLSDIPYDKMWPDTRHWFGFLLDRSSPEAISRQFSGTVVHGGDDEKDLRSVDIWDASTKEKLVNLHFF